MKDTNFQSAPLLQRIGIAPGLVAIVVIADSLLFGGEAATLGATLVLSIPAGIALAAIATFWQRKFYQDSIGRALIKGIILGILTAIPTPIASVVAILGAVLPMFQQESDHLNEQRRHSQEDENSSDDESTPPIRKAKGKTLS